MALNDFIWNGEMDCGWEDLSELLKKTCRDFTENMLRTIRFNPNTESIEMVSEVCMERFESITSVLADFIKEGVWYTYEDIDCKAQNAIKLNGWILLGSLTESILQMFLAFYIDDYKNTKWQQWEDFEVDRVQKPIIACIKELESGNLLTNNQANSLKGAIKDKIKEHTKEHHVQKVMLEELIQLYQYLELMNEDEILYLKQIQSNRNGIHSFQERDIGTWSDLQYCTRFFCCLLEWVINHLPDIPDVEYC